ncbi:tRNA adenosine(34) deaminase TadA [Gammaproteobacteria bacterium]|jgi:tRNA(adenine34) deaminase|nr:tRNA adenosine(34) deaminase TadA [Gammaproteobacteria bacterium]
MSSYSQEFMKIALQQARMAFNRDEVPVGAVITWNNKVLGYGHNQVITQNSVTAHAEILAIISASRSIHNYRLNDCDIYVTLEPCHMCAKAIVDARFKNLFFGALEPKTGAVISIDKFLDSPHLNHKVSYSSGHLKKESALLLKSFFKARRL